MLRNPQPIDTSARDCLWLLAALSCWWHSDPGPDTYCWNHQPQVHFSDLPSTEVGQQSSINHLQPQPTKQQHTKDKISSVISGWAVTDIQRLPVVGRCPQYCIGHILQQWENQRIKLVATKGLNLETRHFHKLHQTNTQRMRSPYMFSLQPWYT